MAIVREVLAAFSVLVDDRPLTKLDKRINTLKDRISKFGAVAGGGLAAGAYGLFQLGEMASNADETVSGLNATFKANAAAAMEWAKQTGDAMQRSRFTLNKSLFDFGKFLRPTFEGTNKDILEMSENLSKLAVDLASFHDTSDEEAQMRLFSGLTGETEAVRRLGINISDEALTSMNKARGDSRSVTQLSLQEKTWLRYQKILQDSSDAHGDAARSAHRWAGQFKEFKEGMKTAAIELGQYLMPLLLGAMKAVKEGVQALTAAIKFCEINTSIFRAVLVGTFAVGMGLATKKLIELTIANWETIKSIAFFTKEILITNGGLKKAALTAGVAAAAFLVLEDAITFARGGASILGDVLTAITGASNPLGMVERRMGRLFAMVGEFFEEIVNALTDAYHAIVELAGGPKHERKFGTAWGRHDQQEKERDYRKLQQRDQAVREGDLNGFIQARLDEESDAAALERFKTERRALVESGEVAVTQNDIDSGFKATSGIQMAPMNITGDIPKKYRGGAAGQSTSTRNTNNQVTINITAPDAEAAGQSTKEVMMRLDYEADGEEL